MTATATKTEIQRNTDFEALVERFDLAREILAAASTIEGQWAIPYHDADAIKDGYVVIPSQTGRKCHRCATVVYYLTNAHDCTCPDATFGYAAEYLGHWCKHRIAVWLRDRFWREVEEGKRPAPRPSKHIRVSRQEAEAIAI